jgi:hypothetical protein
MHRYQVQVRENQVQEIHIFRVKTIIKTKNMKACGLNVRKDTVFCATNDGKGTREVKPLNLLSCKGFSGIFSLLSLVLS